MPKRKRPRPTPRGKTTKARRTPARSSVKKSGKSAKSKYWY